MSRTLLVTNDFPPRPGGIQQFVHNLAVRQPPGSLVVYASRWGEWEDFDAQQPFPVVREATSMLLPTPAVARRAQALARTLERRPDLIEARGGLTDAEQALLGELDQE